MNRSSRGSISLLRAALALAVCVASAPGIAPAAECGSDGGVVTLCRENTVLTSTGGSVDVVIPQDTELWFDPAGPDVQLLGGDREFVGFALRRDNADAPRGQDGIFAGVLPLQFAREKVDPNPCTNPCGNGSDGFFAIRLADGMPFTRFAADKIPLAAGAYTLSVFTDGDPVQLRLRFRNLTGTGTLPLSRPVRYDTGDIPMSTTIRNNVLVGSTSRQINTRTFFIAATWMLMHKVAHQDVEGTQWALYASAASQGGTCLFAGTQPDEMERTTKPGCGDGGEGSTLTWLGGWGYAIGGNVLTTGSITAKAWWTTVGLVEDTGAISFAWEIDG